MPFRAEIGLLHNFYTGSREYGGGIFCRLKAKPLLQHLGDPGRLFSSLTVNSYMGNVKTKQLFCCIPAPLPDGSEILLLYQFFRSHEAAAARQHRRELQIIGKSLCRNSSRWDKLHA